MLGFGFFTDLYLVHGILILCAAFPNLWGMQKFNEFFVLVFVDVPVYFNVFAIQDKVPVCGA